MGQQQQNGNNIVVPSIDEKKETKSDSKQQQQQSEYWLVTIQFPPIVSGQNKDFFGNWSKLDRKLYRMTTSELNSTRARYATNMDIKMTYVPMTLREYEVAMFYLPNRIEHGDIVVATAPSRFPPSS
jgi:hypothetical protein